MKRKLAWLWMSSLLGLAFIITTGVILNKTIPDVDSQLSALQPIILVDITQPLYGQQVLVGESIGIYVMVDSEKQLEGVEAYVNGDQLAFVASSALDERRIMAVFNWSPGTE